MPAEIELNAPGGDNPSSPADFQQAALKAFEEKPDAFPVPEAKEPPAAEAEKPGEEKPEAKEPPAEKEPEGSELVALAKKDAELRKRERAVKDAERAQGEKMHKAELMLKAIESGDPLELLAAGGFNYRQVVEQLTQGKTIPKPAANKGGPPADIQAALEPLAKQVQQLQAQVLNYQASEHRQKLTSDAEALAKEGGDKFKFTVGRGKLPEAVRYLEEHWQEYQELPVPGDYKKSLRVALEAVEHKLREEAKSWEPLLTGGKGSVNVPGTDPAKDPSKEAASPPGRSGGITTLSNRTAAPRGTADKRPVPTSPEEYQRAALEALLKESSG